MGSSNSIIDEKMSRITNEQISQLNNGTISPISFKIFLHNFYFVLRYPKFYTDLSIKKYNLIFESVGVLTQDECIRFVSNFCKYSEIGFDLFSFLHSISLKMICKISIDNKGTQVYIPVGLDQRLWKPIMQKKFKTSYGHFNMKKQMIDWSSSNVKKERDIFINEKQNQISKIKHTKDLYLLIQSNPIENLWKINDLNLNFKPNKALTPKPSNWERNVHQASFHGNKCSLEYSLFLIPEIFNLPDDNNENLVHHAVSGNQNNILIYLHEIGADFNLINKNGYKPIHLVKQKTLIYTMNDLGIDVNEKAENGETLLEICTKKFNLEMIKVLLELGADIFEPNEKGTFWIQAVLHEKHLEKDFVKLVHKIISKNNTAKYNNNHIYQEIKNRNFQGLQNDLYNSVKNQNIPRIKILLALGAIDKVSCNYIDTNLCYCAKNGKIEIAKILLNNYSNPNYTDKYGHNTFWMASINENFKIASILLKYGAKKNLIDKNGETLLLNSYRNKKMNTFNYALKTGADIKIKNKKGQTITFLAFLNRDDEIAEMLQDRYKGDINCQDRNKNSLVHLAFIQGDMKRIDYLSKRRINMNLKDRKGKTVLQHAFFNNADSSTLDFLIKKGSNVNVVDDQNNTLLHLLLYEENPSEEIFKLLINRKINFNIKNNEKQFPISIAIKQSHDNFGFKLLNLKCKLTDKKSIHEPIVEALKRGSSKWFEALIDHGADALNVKYPVAAKYIKSSFYKIEVFRKIPRMNLYIGSPLQEALYKDYNKCALNIWYREEFYSRKKLAWHSDSYGRIPLSVAIMKNNCEFVDMLLHRIYDCESSDDEGRTPFIYACITNNIKWMNDLYQIISSSNADMVDIYHFSALTYAANNKRIEFCNKLFYDDIDIENCNKDKFGIIKNYQYVTEKHKVALNLSESNYNRAKFIYERVKNRVLEVEKEKKDINDKISYINCQYDYIDKEYADPYEIRRVHDMEKEVDDRKPKIEEEMRRLKPILRRAEYSLNHYKERYNTIRKATKRDILNNISHYIELGEKDMEFE